MELVVENLEERVRIDKYIADNSELSRSQIDKLIDNKLCTVNGDIVSSSYKVKNDDYIELDTNILESDEDILPVKMDLDIVYEDDDLMIINKPSGLVVHPGSGNKDNTLVSGLLYYTNNLSDINGSIRPGIVHRIDKDTSGLMVVAKNNRCHMLLAEMLSKHEIKREYIALLKGVFMHDTADIDAPIGRDKLNRKKMTVTSENSKNAITHLKVLKRYDKYTLVKLNLETGRTHQIRVHMSYIGYPIYNDPVYTNDNCTEFGQFLHSSTIEFDHPITHKHLHFSCELPEIFKNFIDTLESNTNN